MDFTLTNEQMIEYVTRCIDEQNQDCGEIKFKFEVLDINYPDMTINFILKKANLSTTCVLTFTKNYVFCRYNEISKNMQIIYIKYMYELFGDEYLKELETDMRAQISESKKSASIDYNKRVNALDNQLLDYLLLLNDIRNTTL